MGVRGEGFMARITIIGGSGFVGRAVARQALAAGHEVGVACRYPERARDLLVEGASLFKVDVVAGTGIEAAVAEADTVIYLVGLLFERGAQRFSAVHVDGVKRVLQACEQAGVKQYLHMSALGVDQVPESDYAATKMAGESLVTAANLSWTIFRPSVIYGAGDSFFQTFKAMSEKLPVLPVVCGKTRFQPVWVEDVARCFVASIGHQEADGQVYELGGVQQYTLQELLTLLMKELGHDRILLPLPDVAAKLLAVASSLLPTPLLTMDQLKLLQHDNVVQGSTPFPACFGEPATVEQVLPSYIATSVTARRQRIYDRSRQHYRQGGV